MFYLSCNLRQNGGGSGEEFVKEETANGYVVV